MPPILRYLLDPRLIWLCAIACIRCASGQTEYAPNQADPVLEPWRWSDQELLHGYSFRSISERFDGSFWFAIDGGVLRYDGLNRTVYSQEDGLPEGRIFSVLAAQDGFVYALHSKGLFALVEGSWKTIIQEKKFSEMGMNMAEDYMGQVWVATRLGLLRIKNGEILGKTIFRAGVWQVVTDAKRNLWIANRGTRRILVAPIKPDGSLTERTSWEAHRPYPIGSSRKQLCAAPDGSVWAINTLEEHGPMRFDPINKRWESFDLTRWNGSNRNKRIHAMSNGEVWIGGAGLLQIYRNGKWNIYDGVEGDLPIVPDEIYESRDGSVWLSSSRSHFWRVDLSENQYSNFPYLTYQCQVGEDETWFLHADGRAIRWNEAEDLWIAYSENEGLMDAPRVLRTSPDGEIWAAGGHRGMAAVSRLDGERWTRFEFPKIGRFFGERGFHISSTGDVYAGCGHAKGVKEAFKGGTAVFRRSGKDYAIDHLRPPRTPFWINGFAETEDGTIWTGSGELRFFEKARDTDRFFNRRDGSGIWFDRIESDEQGRLWVVRWGSGVQRLESNKWVRFTEDQGLASNVIVDLACGEDGSVWAGTSAGISRFDGKQWIRFGVDRRLSIESGRGDIRVSKSGDLWVNRYSAKRFHTSLPAHKRAALWKGLGATRIRPMDAEMLVRIDPIAERISESQPLVVRWSGSSKWSSPPSSEMQYSYRLSGGNWSPYSQERSAIFEDLSNGKHTLEIRVRERSPQSKAMIASVGFEVVPPLWKQLWFISMVTAFAVSIIGLLVFIYRMRIVHAENLIEAKDRFFTHVSHELKTPLSVIIGPLEAALESMKNGKVKAHVAVALQNAEKMSDLVNKLLEVRKLKARRMPLERKEDDVARHFRECAALHRPRAEFRSIQLNLKTSLENKYASYCPEGFERVFDNLLENAIKYTKEGGSVAATLEVEENWRSAGQQLILTVEDSGIGIPEDCRAEIFESFRRSRRSEREGIEGTGIGLAFVKDLVDQMSGKIEVESPINRATESRYPGTRFTVTLPIEAAEPDQSVEMYPDFEDEEEDLSLDRIKVVVVEDNADMRAFVAGELRSEFCVTACSDGEKGLEAITNVIPDVVLTDVMMPNMDGINMCKRLKAEPLTCHVPVIMLTARASKEKEMDGLLSGADDYIAKPVRIELLKTKIRNLIRMRQRIREQTKRRLTNAEEANVGASKEEVFLQKASEEVETRLSDYKFDSERLAEILNVSRSTLYRKMKAVTDLSPTAFIRMIRLNKAAELLKTGQFKVTEVIEKVGILDHSYFSSRFKEQFNCSPSEYARKSQRAKDAFSG